MPEPKFIVWGPGGATNPKVVFSSRMAAKRAAHDMARLNRGQRFYVMIAIDEFEATDVQHTVLVTGTDDIPF